MAVVTNFDVEAVSGRQFNSDELDLADALIPLVQGDLEAWLGRSVEVVETTEIQLVDFRTQRIFLRNTPVESIDEVLQEGSVVDSGQYRKLQTGLSFWGWSPNINFSQPLLYMQEFEITYTGGLDGANIPAVRSAVIAAVLRSMALAAEGDTARSGITALKVEDFSMTRAAGFVGGQSTEGVGLFTQSELRPLTRYKKRTVVSG